MSFFGGMPQYYEMRNDPLNRPGTMPMTKIDPRREALFGEMLPRDAEIEFIREQMQGPRQYNPLLFDRNPMNNPRLNSAGMANIHPDVRAAVYSQPDQYRNQQNVEDIIQGGQQEILGSRSGRIAETPDGAIRQEMLRRTRRR